MQAVILAAGQGKRMRGLTKEIPKPMLKIKGKPILEHKINMLPKKIKEVIIVVGHCGEHILRHFKGHFAGRRIVYVYQMNMNGTGGALHLSRSLLRDKFLVMMGDDLYHSKDLNRLIKHDLGVLGYEVNNPMDFGVIKTDTRGHMVEVIENPRNAKFKLVNTGVYVLNKKFFDYELVPKKAGSVEMGLPQTMAQMARNHKIKVEKATLWHPIGCPEDLRKAEELLHKFL